MFEGEVLQGPSHLTLLSQQQNVIIELKGIEYAQLYAYGNSWSTLLDARNCKWGAGRTFCNLCHTEITTQTRQLDLLANSPHLLFKLSWKLCTHRRFAHNSIQCLFTDANLQHFLYFIIG